LELCVRVRRKDLQPTYVECSGEKPFIYAGDWEAETGTNQKKY